MTVSKLDDKKYFLYNTYGVSNKTVLSALKEEISDYIMVKVVFDFLQEGVSLASLYNISAINEKTYNKLSLLIGEK